MEYRAYRAETELGALARDLLDDLERVRPGFPATDSAEPVQQAVAARVHLRLGEIYRDHSPELFELSVGLSVEPSAGLLPEAAPRTSADPALANPASPVAPAEPAELALYRREIDQILLPRYATLAAQHNQRELARARKGQSGYNRAAYALIFFLIGVFVVWAPFIPIEEKWVPFLLAALSPLASPLLPDLHGFIDSRRYQLSLLTLLIDVDQAGKSLPAPPLELPPTRHP